MKKWLIALAALVLVLIPSVAMAKIASGRSYYADCPGCGSKEQGFVASDIYISENDHWFSWHCMSCFEQYDIIQSHYGGEATCSAKAKCEGCNAFYGEKNPSNHTWVEATCQAPKTCSGCGATEGEKNLNNHNWGDWTKLDDDYHSRACQNSGCTQTQSERHTEKSPANCTRAAICKVCHQEYGSTNPTTTTGAIGRAARA